MVMSLATTSANVESMEVPGSGELDSFIVNYRQDEMQ